MSIKQFELNKELSYPRHHEVKLKKGQSLYYQCQADNVKRIFFDDSELLIANIIDKEEFCNDYAVIKTNFEDEISFCMQYVGYSASDENENLVKEVLSDFIKTKLNSFLSKVPKDSEVYYGRYDNDVFKDNNADGYYSWSECVMYAIV